MNRRGDLAITLLVVGVFAVCALALLVFIFSLVSTQQSFVGVDLVDTLNADLERYAFYGDLSLVQSRERDGTLVFYQELRETSGFLFWKEERLVFLVEYSPPTPPQ